MSRSAMLGMTALALLGASPALAQKNHAVIVSGYGGGYSALRNLNDAGTVDFKTGWNAGGGIGVEVNKYAVVEGTFTFAQSRFRTSGVDSTKFNKLFYGGDIRLQYPFPGGFTPYVFGGGGAVTIHQKGTTGLNKTKGAGLFGVGADFRVPRSKFSIFVRGTGYVYKISNFSGGSLLTGFNRTQIDVTYSGGISYRFPI